MQNLVNLRHLDIGLCIKLEEMPREMGKLQDFACHWEACLVFGNGTTSRFVDYKDYTMTLVMLLSLCKRDPNNANGSIHLSNQAMRQDLGNFEMTTLSSTSNSTK
ncbi:putative disease resistance protein [Trifolium repens]|nr:putative disease resistance protein [Trifolium repens]